MRVKRKTVDYKQFELFDKIHKELTLDGETKNFTKEIKNREKIVVKKDLQNILATNLLH